MNERQIHDLETVRPYNDSENKGSQIERMFDTIAPAYDRMNRLMTLGLDLRWRRKALKMLAAYRPRTVLDVACGTGDLSLLIHKIVKPEKITGIDLSDGMLEVARRKRDEAGLQECIAFERQDCLALTFPDASCDAVTVAFGVRNFQQLRQGISEMYRVLRRGGVLVIIELSTPVRFPFDRLYRFYAGSIIPCLGRLFTQDKQAYTYLPRSIEMVPQREEMTDILREAGFGKTRYIPFTFGVCTVYIGEK